MRLVGLISGGKDSCYNLMQCVAAGHEIVALAHLTPALLADELDSFMYQSVGHEAVGLYASALELPLYQRSFLPNTGLCLGADYVPTDGDEVEALHDLLAEVKAKESIEAVSVGAILSNYQRVRVENVCSRLGLTVLAYMWRRDQKELLAEMIAANLRAIVVKVATLGLTPARHLGKEISELYPHLVEMNERYGINICGEGGEYETFTLDCPLFKKSIVIDEQTTVVQDANEISPVAYLRLTKCSLRPKTISRNEIITDNCIRGPESFLLDLDLNVSSDCCIPTKESSQLSKRDVWPQTRSPKVTKLRKGWTMISGITAEIETGRDVAMATSNAIRLLIDILSVQNMTKNNLVTIQLFVANMDDFEAINGAYKGFFDLNPPSRVCVQVPLPKDVLFLMDCVAYVGKQSIKHMHVQGISHWAPANIGPYSQAVQVTDEVIVVSGQIPLVPGTMQLVGDDIIAQCRLSLRHVVRVLDAMQNDRIAVDTLISCVCYVTHPSYVQAAQDAFHWMFYLNHPPKGNDNTTADDSIQKKVPIIYVVVSGLPRKAHVEWQVVAKCKVEDTVVSSGKRLEDVVVDGVKLTSLVVTNGLTVLQVQLSVSHLSRLSESKTLSNIFRQIIQLMQLCNHDIDSCIDAAHYQIFYDVNKVTNGQLSEGWESVMGDNHTGLSLIPVLAVHPIDETVFASILVKF